MAAYKDVILKSIGKVRVHRPPNMKIHRMVSAKYHYPPQPTKQVEMYRGKNEPPDIETILMVEGPEYDAWKGECDSIDAARFGEINEYNFLFALRDVKVPDGFDVEAEYGEFARSIDPNWNPRPRIVPNLANKLDYLEWVVLGLSDDETTVGEALNELLGIDLEVVQDIKDNFQGDVEGPAA